MRWKFYVLFEFEYLAQLLNAPPFFLQEWEIKKDPGAYLLYFKASFCKIEGLNSLNLWNVI